MLANSETILGAKLSPTLIARIETRSRQWGTLSLFLHLLTSLDTYSSQLWFCDLSLDIPQHANLWNLHLLWSRLIEKVHLGLGIKTQPLFFRGCIAAVTTG